MRKIISHRQLFLNYLAQTSDDPMALEVDYAEGIYIYDIYGKKYIDLISGIGVSNIGHRHPKVINMIKKQLDKYMHVMVYGEFVQTPQVLLAKHLCNTLPDDLNSVYLVNSGSEAIEGAMKLAKRHTGKYEIISCVNAYHGSTQGALSLAGNEVLKQNFRPLIPLTHKRIKFGEADDLKIITPKTAAVIVETVQGEAGVKSASTDYFKKLRKRCNQTDSLLVLDEIQCGWGRTGTFWAFDQYDIVPDILVSAKGMGGGMPIGCFISNKNIMRDLTHQPVLGHITTFGGHPVSATAANATLDVILSENLIEKVKEKEQLFLERIQHPSIMEIRSNGLMIALQFDSFKKTKKIVNKCLQYGVIVDWFLFNNTSIRIAPPLTISESEIITSCKLLLKAIAEAYTDGG